MMKASFKRTISLWAVIALSLSGPSAFSQPVSADSLTVEDVIQGAIRNNPAVLQAAANAQASNARVSESKTSRLPSVGFDGSYVRIGPVPQLFFPGLGDFKLYPENNYDAHIGVRETVYDFGKTSSNVDVAQSQVRTAEQNIELVKSGLTYQSIQLFYSILFLQQSIDVENRDIEALNQHLLVNKKRLQAGTGTNFEVLTTQVRVAAAKNQKIDIENMLHKQEVALRRLLGIPDSVNLNLRGDFTLMPVGLNRDSLIAVALRQRPEVLAAQAVQMTSNLQFRSVKLADMPVVSINGAYGVKNGYIPNLDILRGNWVAGIDLRIPLYEGGITGYKEQEAEATLNGSTAHLADVERQVSAEVKQSISDVRASGDKLQSAALQVEQATAALDIAQKSYDTGTVSNLDVLDAETALSQANLFRLRALYEFVTSRYALERAIGTAIWNQ